MKSSCFGDGLLQTPTVGGAQLQTAGEGTSLAFLHLLSLGIKEFSCSQNKTFWVYTMLSIEIQRSCLVFILSVPLTCICEDNYEEDGGEQDYIISRLAFPHP